MPSGDEIQRYLTGAWQLMLGRRDGVKLLDLSADGFWNSFYAIVVALPAMFVGWVGTVNGYGDQVAEIGGRSSVLFRLALIDMSAWLVPLIVFGMLAKPMGVADRFVAFVVASNWSSVITAWMLLPIAILEVFLPSANQVSDALALVLFMTMLVLVWRLTNAVIDRGPGIASAVFALILFVSIFVIIALQDVLGLVALAQPAG